jgi:uncharacterized membrane protein YqjE
MSAQPRTPSENDLFEGGAGDEKSAGQLIKEVTEDVSTLIRKEVELAKQELGRSITTKIKGAIMLAIVGVLGFFLLIFLLLAVRDGFSELWADWIADLATVGVLAFVSVIVGLIAKKKLMAPISAELTKKNVKEDVELMKHLGRR